MNQQQLYHSIAMTAQSISRHGYSVSFIPRASDGQALVRVSHKNKVVTVTLEGKRMDLDTLVRLRRALRYGIEP